MRSALHRVLYRVGGLALVSFFLCAPSQFTRSRMTDNRMSAGSGRMIGGRMLGEQRGGPSFDLTFNNGGLAALSSSLTINGTTVSPSLRYIGEDAVTTTWTADGYGETLTLQAGTAPTLDQETPTADTADRAVKYNVGGFHQAAGTSTGDIATEDFVIEMVVHATGVSGAFFSKRDNTSPNAGWTIYIDGTPAFEMAFDVGASTATVQSAAITANAWYHAMLFVDRSGSAQWYVNGAASGGTTDMTSYTATATNPEEFVIGSGREGAALDGDHTIAYISMWKSAAWLDTHLQAAVAKERASKLTGLWPDVHHGTAVPNVMSRTTTKTTFKASEMFVLGANWLDTVGQQYRSEGAITNKLIQSDDFTTSWAELNASTNDTTDTAGNGDPYGTDKGDGVVAAAEAAEHGFSQAATLTAVTWTQSVWVKAGSVDFVVLDDSTVANTTTWFQISTCAAATTGAAVLSTFAVNATTGGWATGWCRVGIAYTGTAAPHTIRYLGDDADNGGASYTGDGAAINYILAGAQVELADHMTSLQPTVAAAADRGPDLLQYKTDTGNYGDGNGGIGTLEVVATLADMDQAVAGTFASMSDGGLGTERHLLYSIAGVTDGTSIATAKVGGDAGAVTNTTTDVSDGTERTHRYTWKTDLLTLYLDGASIGTPDTTVDPPVGQDELDIGVNNSDGAPLNGTINRIRLWTTVQVP